MPRISPLALLLTLSSVLPAQDKAASDIVEAGRENWVKPWVPDLKKPDGRISIPEDKRIDIAILGDGYLADERAAFEKDVRDWYEEFLSLTPWNRFRGAFRVRGLFTPGAARSTPDVKSHYKLPATASGVGNVGSPETAEAIFRALDRLGVNAAASRGRLTHTAVVMLVKNEK